MNPEMTQNQQNSTSDFSLVPECKTRNEDQECRMSGTVPSCPPQNVDESEYGEVALEPDAIQSEGEKDCDMDPVPESLSPAKGWVIGPLFQSFKSKMASFTEIVMSSAKLLKPTDILQSTVSQDFPEHLDTDQVINSEQDEAVNLEANLEKLDENECRIAGTETGLIQTQDEAGSCYSLDSNQGGLESQEKHFGRSRGRKEKRIDKPKHPVVQNPSVVQKLHVQLKSCHLLEKDKCALEKRRSVPESHEQKDVTEKESNNNDPVPCKRSRLLHSSIKPGPESAELSSSPLPLPLYDDTSALCGSKLKPDIQMVEQVGLTGPQRKSARRKRHVGPKSAAKSSSLETELSDMPCNSGSRLPEIDGKQFALKCDSPSTANDSKDAQSSISSLVYYTPPESLCSLVDGEKRHTELHGNQDMLMCGTLSQVSVRNSPGETSTVHEKDPASRTSHSKTLQQHPVEREAKCDLGSTRRGRKLKVAASANAERNFEKSTRVKLTRGERCLGEIEREGLAGVQSCTLASLEDKEHVESSGSKVSRKRGSAKAQYQKGTLKTAGSVVVDTEDILELPETNAVVKEKGTGRKDNVVKLSASLPEKTTSSITGQEEAPVMKTTDGLSSGNSKVKRAPVNKEQDCFSNSKRLKKQKSTCYSHSETGSVELNSIPMVKATMNDPNSGGIGLHTEGQSETSRTLEKVQPKKITLALDERKSSRNRRKCCTAVQSDPSGGDKEGMQSPLRGASPKLAVRLNKHAVKRFLDNARNGIMESMDESVTHHGRNVTVDLKQNEEEVSEQPGNAAPERRKHRKEHGKKPGKASNQRRRRKSSSASKVKEEEEVKQKGEEICGGSGARPSDHGVLTGRLLRRHSCPEILSLLHHDSPRTLSLHRRQPAPHSPHPLRSSRRARRHTVCSVEVEREIAPLCLRKEVYPTRACAPYGSSVHHLSPSVPLSPSTSLSAQACCFLSSPLAFLSKKTNRRSLETSGNGCRGVASSLPPCVSTSSSPSRSSISSLCNALSQVPLERERDTRQQSDYDDREDTSCSSQEFESVVMREEKALSDSEIKMGSCKNEERGKVSSIRIRRTVPKPQENLTPMGLPRPVRLKKKEFSLEEIYTNKNFTKPPLSRLETIFETPLNRRNGSQSLIGQKRLKRFVEFPALGEVRRPRKLGAGKAGMSSAVVRPRRRNAPNSKEDQALSLQDFDSLLCSKLDELDCWLYFNQETC